MADRDEDLRTYILADGTVAGITDQLLVNDVDAAATLPLIWMRESKVEWDDSADPPEPAVVNYDVECCALSLDAAKDLAAAVTARLAGTHGTLTSTAVAWISIADQYDDYTPRMIEADERLQIAAIAVEVMLA